MMNSVLILNYSQEEIIKKYNMILTLTPASREELSWWASLQQVLVGASLCSLQPTITVHLDAYPVRAEVLYSMARRGQEVYGPPKKQPTT